MTNKNFYLILELTWLEEISYSFSVHLKVKDL